MMKRTLSWIVGMDLTERSHGAILFARWLHEHREVDARLIGVHVLSAGVFRSEHPGDGPPLDRARSTAVASAEALGAASAFDDFEILTEPPPEQALADLAQQRGARGLILGRSGTIEGWSLVSLGRVTRRLLRHAPVPTFVVPPDLELASLGRGPVLVAVDTSPQTAHAARFGRELARQLGLSVMLVHVLPDLPVPPMAAADPTLAYATAMAEQQRREAAEPPKIHEWIDEHGLGGLPLKIVEGRRGPQLLEVARSERASLIVCGSRQLTLAERIFMSSTGSEVAAKADVPVAVVPPLAD